MNGTVATGLRRAKQIGWSLRLTMKGDRSDYARGYRQALTDLLRMIDNEILAKKARSAK